MAFLQHLAKSCPDGQDMQALFSSCKIPMVTSFELTPAPVDPVVVPFSGDTYTLLGVPVITSLLLINIEYPLIKAYRSVDLPSIAHSAVQSPVAVMSHVPPFEHHAERRDTVDPYADSLDIDVLIVGAGFGGLFLLHELRKEGYQIVVYEAAEGIGGTWRWNVHPGSRVDSEIPAYELSIPEVWKDWTWSTNFPNYQELQRYFVHVDEVLDLSKDCAFNTTVVSAEFSKETGKWTVKTLDGRICKCRFLIVATGFTTKRFVPEFKGIDKFQGKMYHSSAWPTEDVNVRGKRCAVIGTGPSGVQIVQEWSPFVGELKVFQRTPNFAIPMGRKELTADEQNKLKPLYAKLFAHRELSFSGFTVDMEEKNTFDVTQQEREAFYERLWTAGSFAFWLGNFRDYLLDYEANREAYSFWARKQRAKIHDVRKRDVLCPLDPPPHYLFGIKRPCLEQRYYEQFNRPNIDVIDVSASCGESDIAEFTETGIRMTNGTNYDFDVIALATGFDITTGGITELGLRSIHGTCLKDEWKTTAYSYLGTTISGYPNLFYLYGPQGPMVLSNGAATVEVQGRWIRDVIKKINAQGLKYIDPTKEATMEWKKRINDLSHGTLFSAAPRSTYMGGGIPGKAPQQVNYTGGLGKYKEEIRAALPGWKGFRIVAGAAPDTATCTAQSTQTGVPQNIRAEPSTAGCSQEKNTKAPLANGFHSWQVAPSMMQPPPPPYQSYH